jgi:hypothetical protein
MRARYGSKPESQRPLTYPNAVDDEFKPWREWLDAQLAHLPSHDARRISKQVWTDARFWPHITELAAGAAMRSIGLSVVYEWEWDGLTPDWTVVDETGAPLCFVEVHTDQERHGIDAEIRDWFELQRRIADIAVPVVLVLDAGGRKPKRPDAGKARRVTETLRRQLLEPWRRGVYQAEGYTFRVMADSTGRAVPSPKGLRAHFFPPTSMAGSVSAEDLVKNVEAKVAKYRRFANAYGVPLIVAAGASKFTGIGLSNLDNLLQGNRVITFQFNAGDSFIGEATMDWARPAQWHMPPGLSGILWVSNDFPFPVVARPNDAANRPMPPFLLFE